MPDRMNERGNAPPHVAEARTERLRLGERLLGQQLISDPQLRQALEVQRRTGAFLGQILVDLGAIDARIMGQYLARDCGVPYVDLLTVRPDPEAVKRAPENLVRETRAIPIRMTQNGLEVAMLDPLDVGVIDRFHQVTGLRILPRLTMAWELQRTIDEYFDANLRASQALQELEAEEGDRGGRARQELVAASAAPIVRLVDSLIEGAIAQRASDVHFEPQERNLRVRYRIDGTLIEQTEVPRSQQASVVARLKALCLMDITESRRPQDGRLRYDHHGRDFDLRVSSVPTVFGEKIVLRILDKSSVMVPLAKLGFLEEQERQFEHMIRQPHGMVLVVGPTGSGKSTTLYSSLNLLNDSVRNIMTLEDPVEYNVLGLNQVQVNSRIGLTFASGLRTFVRQDPDVILVGEIRDQETAEMAIQASLTGHLMLSTLHANSAIGAIARLANLGVDRFLISQALSGVVSQRLVACICPHCLIDYVPASELLQSVGISPEQAREIRFRRGAGCRACHGRGYLGRMGVYEVLVLNDELRLMVMRNASETEIEAVARRDGMRMLRDSAYVAVRAGITTPEEMGRVVLMRDV